MTRTLHLLAALAALAVVGAWAAPTATASEQTLFSGQATVVRGTVLGIPITLVDTGPVAPEGGDLSETLLCYPPGPDCTINLPDLTNGALDAEVLHAAVVAQGNQSSAEASVAEVELDAAGHSVDAALLQAEATARCDNGFASISGTAEVASLTIDGQEIVVTGVPNQTVTLPGGVVVVINEQIASVSAKKGDITVRALHIRIPGPVPGTDTDLIIAEAHADIFCGGGPGGCRGDRITGGGWYTWNGDRVHFALAARNGVSSWGHLLYQHKAIGLRVRGNPVVSTLTPKPGSRNDGTALVQGTASASGPVNGGTVGWFEVIAVDDAEPGRTDQFAIVLLTAQRSPTSSVLYTANVDASGSVLGDRRLEGGNLQYHNCR